jgi:hypothetical protein
MKPYAQEAENLRLLLLAGIVSVDDVVAWADRTISTLPEYDDDLTEISLGAKLPEDEMGKRLLRISTGADHLEAIRNLAGQMHRVLLSDKSRAEEFARWLEWLYYENGRKFPDDLAYVWDEDGRISKVESAYGWLYDNLITATAPFDPGDSEEG